MNFKKILAISAACVFAFLTNTALAQEPVQSTTLEVFSQGYNKYVNNPYGYEAVLPDSIKLNEDIVSVKSRFESENLVVDILYDNFDDDLNNIDTYLGYANRGILNNPAFKITREYDKDYSGLNGHVVIYERKKIENGIPDCNYYATVAFARSYKESITVFIKSAQPINIDYVMPNFKFIDKYGTMKQDAVFEPVNKEFDEKTQAFYNKYLEDSEKASFGIFEPSYPFYSYELNKLENMFDYEFPVTLIYNSFQSPYKTDQMNKAKEDGKVVEYGLYTTDAEDGKEKDITLEIIEGKYDEYLDNLAQNFKQYDYPVLFRLNNEMNGEWVSYCAHNVGKDTDLFIRCWRYIYDRFKEHGVDNVIFVWNPNEKSFPNFAYNHYLNYYPGNEYVDVVGLTAYNTGDYYDGEVWRSFSEAYDPFYYDYARHFKHPMMITEFSCASAGGNKSMWFDDMFTKMPNYDRIKLAVLWNGQDFDTEKPGKVISRNYRLDLEHDITESIKRGLQKFK